MNGIIHSYPQLHWPHFRCSVGTGGWCLPRWTGLVRNTSTATHSSIRWCCDGASVVIRSLESSTVGTINSCYMLRQCEKYNNKDMSQYINIREWNILHNSMGVGEYPPEERGISDRIWNILKVFVYVWSTKAASHNSKGKVEGESFPGWVTTLLVHCSAAPWRG